MDTSGDALDSSGNDFDGTVIGATQSATGVTLDGVNDEVINTEAALTTALAGISVYTVFVRASSSAFTSFDATFSMGDSNDNDAFSMYCYDSAAGNGCQIWIDGSVIMSGAGTAPADGTNADFCFVSRSATDQELFVDGVSEDTSVTSKSLAASFDGVTLGRYIGNGEWFAGGVQELIIYDRALTDAQILALTQRYL